MSQKKSSGTGCALIAIIMAMLLLFALTRNSKTPGYHYKDGYVDRKGQYHKPTVVKDSYRKKNKD